MGAAGTKIDGRGVLTLAGLMLAAGIVVLATFWPVHSAQALTFDDQQFLLHNHLVRHPSWASVRQFFGEVLEPSTVKGYYLPLSMTSLMLDCAFGGGPENLRPFHVTSLALHVLNTLLVITLLVQLFGAPWPAALAGLLFGLHPLTVEPVAWVGERKTLLATFFTLWCLISYVAAARRKSWTWFGVSIAAYVLALLSKPTSLPLVVVLPLLDYWPLKRLNWRTLAAKTPFAVVAAIFAVITIISHDRTAGITTSDEAGIARVPLQMAYLVGFYILKLIAPINLTPYYPLPDPLALTNVAVLARVLIATAAVVVALLAWRFTRAVAVGGAVFVLMLLPTLGVVQYSWITASDKYVYLPAIGLLLILTWVLVGAWTAATTPRRAACVLIVLALAAVEIVGTRMQLSRWQNTEELCRYMLALAPQAAPVHDDLGTELVRQGRLEEGVEHYRAALASDPEYFKAHNNLGIALMHLGRLDEAVAHLHATLQLQPDHGSAHNTLGMILARRGRLDEALEHLERALAVDPNIGDVHANVANVYLAQQQTERAIRHYQEALRLEPGLPGLHKNLGLAFAIQGDYGRAAEAFELARQQEPGNPQVLSHLGRALVAAGRTAEGVRAYDAAIQQYQAVLRTSPNDPRLQAGLQQAQAERAAAGSP